MLHMTLNGFISTISDTYRGMLIEAEKSALWNATSIRREGREPELRQLRAFYEKLKEVYEASPYAETNMSYNTSVICTAEVFRTLEQPAENDQIIEYIGTTTYNLLQQEIFWGFPSIDWNVPLSVDDSVALRNYLEHKRHFLLYAEEILDIWCNCMIGLWVGLFSELPRTLFKNVSKQQSTILLSSPLISQSDVVSKAIERVLALVATEKAEKHNLFVELRERLQDNIWTVTGVREDQRQTTNKSPVLPSECRHPTETLPEHYLNRTPFLEIFNITTPMPVPDEVRFEHHWIVAGSGHGKTQTLQYLIAKDLEKVRAGETSIVVIDSQGDLIKNISGLKDFAAGQPLADKLCLIDPTDIEYPVALNLFDVGMDRINCYGQLERERLINGILELYDFVIGSLLSAELTQKQAVIFRYIMRLMLHIPNANIQTLRELMEPNGDEKYKEHINQLKGTARAFFETEFNGREFTSTKQQVLRRLWGILENQTFERMFSHPKSKLNLGEEMNSGKVILINTAKELLKQNGTEIFGRFFIAMIAQAAQERAILPKEQRLPCFVYVDECQDYVDQNVALILEQARKYRVGMVLAHQYMGQLPQKIHESFSANTSIKFAGGVSDKDARTLSNMLRTTPDFIEEQPKGSFAVSVRNITQSAASLSCPFGYMEQMERMSDAERMILQETIRRKYAVHHTEVEQSISDQLGEQPDVVDPEDEGDDAAGEW